MPKGSTDFNEQKRQFANEANDSLTSHMHTVFFCDALADFIRLLPNSFVRMPDANPSNLQLGEVAANYEAAGDELGGGHMTTLRIVAAVWSFWDGPRAVKWLLDTTNAAAGTGKPTAFGDHWTACSMTIGQISRVSDGQYRDILARLIAFCPSSLAAVPMEARIVENGRQLRREKKLADNFKEIVSGLEPEQLKEFEHYSRGEVGERGWRELLATLGPKNLVARLDREVAAALRRPSVSLGKDPHPSRIGFDRTTYNRWLEESLGIGRR